MQDFPKYKPIVRELRTELTATAAEVGMRQAVADLGHPRVLADGYLSELGRTGARAGPLVRSGARSRSAPWCTSALAYAIGTLDTLGQIGGGTVEREFLGATTTFTNDDDAISVSSTLTWQVLVFYACVFTVPFLLGARVWRVWARTPAPVHA